MTVLVATMKAGGVVAPALFFRRDLTDNVVLRMTCRQGRVVRLFWAFRVIYFFGSRTGVHWLFRVGGSRLGSLTFFDFECRVVSRG